MKRFFRLLVLAWVVWMISPGLYAQGWKHWRGPEMNGSTTTTNLPTEWSESTNIVWAIPLPGASFSTPIVYNTNIFVASVGSYGRLLLLNVAMKNGTVVWENEIARYAQANEIKEGAEPKCLSSSSPVTDGKRVWVLFGTGDMAGYDYEGNELWKRNLCEEVGDFPASYVYGSSPTLCEGKLYVPVLKPGKSWILCLEPLTGKTLWKQERTTSAEWPAQEAYTTLVPYSGKDGVQLIVSGADCVTAHRAEDGEELWRYAGLSAQNRSSASTYSSPVPVPELGLVFVAGSQGTAWVAIKADEARGLIKDADLAWRHTQHLPEQGTPLYYQDKLYVLETAHPLLTCYNPLTGEKVGERLLSVSESFSGSPTGADGKIYCLGSKGTVVILGSAAPFEEIAAIAMGGTSTRSSIAVSNQRLIVRTNEKLYCIKKRRWIRFMDNVFLD